MAETLLQGAKFDPNMTQDWAANDPRWAALRNSGGDVYNPQWSGLGGQIQQIEKLPDGTFKVLMTPKGADPYKGAVEGILRPGPDGQVYLQGGWTPHTVDSTAKTWGQGIALGAATLGGLNAIGALGGSGAGAGAVGGTGLGVSPGAGLTLGQAGASGAGLSATGGSGLTLAGATGTGTGLAAGTGSGIIGAGIGSTIPAAAALGSTASGGSAGAVVPSAANATNPALIESAVNTPGYGASSAGAGMNAGGTIAAGGSTLPSWLTQTGGKLGGNLASQLLLGGAIGGAAASGGSVDTASQQGIAKTLGDIGLEQANIARDQYTAAKDRISANDPLFTQIIQNALNQQQQQGQRSDQLWSSYATNFLPAAEKFAQTAMNFDTPGRRAEEEARARAGVEADATMQRQAQTRALNRAGISLDSGRALTLDNAQRLQTTKLSTGAADTARRNVEATGLNLLNQTANIGQGIVGTSQQQAGQALTAGNAATSTLGAKESTRNAALAPSQAFYGGATSSLGSAGNTLNQVANVDANNAARKDAGWAGLGSLAGTLLTAPKGSLIGDWLSDPKSKKVHGKMDGKKALSTINSPSHEVYDYTYKPGLGDGGRHIGRMAGKGDAMGPDGMRRVSAQDEMGKHTAAIREVSKQVKSLGVEVAKIKRRLSLADATTVPYREVA